MIDKLLNNEFVAVTSFILNQGSSAQRPDFSKETLSIENSSKGNYEGFDGLSISHAHCQAQVSLYGGQVLSFKPTGHNDLLWLSERNSYKAGHAIRGGIPLCWPWFGENNKQNNEVNSSKHGFARQLPWQVESIDANADGVTLVLVLASANEDSLWPNAFQLKQTLFFGQHLKQTLAMTNLSEEDAFYTAALHSYFRVSNPGNVNIDALTNLTYDDKLTGESKIQEQSVSCIGEIDRIYHSDEQNCHDNNNGSPDTMTLVDTHWQRKIDVISDTCQQWVLWNPGSKVANNMADIHDGGEQEYVCLEAANTQWQGLAAGETAAISQEIHVQKI